MINKRSSPEEFKKLAEDFSKNGFITTSLDNLINWSNRFTSLDDIWIDICAVEMMQTAMPSMTKDLVQLTWFTRQSDVMIVVNTYK